MRNSANVFTAVVKIVQIYVNKFLKPSSYNVVPSGGTLLVLAVDKGPTDRGTGSKSKVCQVTSAVG